MPGRVDASGSSGAERHDLLDLGDADAARGGAVGIEVARGLPVDEVALLVGLPGLDDGEVGDEAALQDVGLAVEVLVLLALGDDRADAGLGVEARDAGAAGADALGQRALRVELELELAARGTGA